MKTYFPKQIVISASAALLVLSACGSAATPNAPAPTLAPTAIPTATPSVAPPTVAPTSAPTAISATATSPKPTVAPTAQATPTANAQIPNGFVTYKHTGGAFSVALPNDWKPREDNNYDKGYVNFVAVGADADMSLEVTDVDRVFTTTELGDMMKQIVTNEFGKLPGFAIKNQDIFTKPNGSVTRIFFDFNDPKQNNARYRAIRIAEYREKKVVVLGSYVLANKVDTHEKIFNVIEGSAKVDFALRYRNLDAKGPDQKAVENVFNYEHRDGAFKLTIPSNWTIEEARSSQTGSASAWLRQPDNKIQMFIMSLPREERPNSRQEFEEALQGSTFRLHGHNKNFKLLKLMPEDPKRPDYAQVTYAFDLDQNGKTMPFWGMASFELSKGKVLFYSVSIFEPESQQLASSVKNIANTLVFK
ncbi:MAG: hypothetical protein KIH69_002685 [Anaerolineae bacterium]|nr:hypothetical protein [Anaerolineae bacterium]